MPKVVFRYINNWSYTMTALKKFINKSSMLNYKKVLTNRNSRNIILSIKKPMNKNSSIF